MAKVVGFGDLLLRLSPPGYQRFLQATNFEINYSGAEANMLVFLAINGIPTEFVTRLPDNLISDCAMAQLRRFGVGLSHVAFGGDRIAAYYLEKGASQRPSRIVYDRKHTGIATASPEDFDWNSIFEGASHFVFTGITPPLGPNLPGICEEACREAKRRGITIVCDLNYRSLLWSLEDASRTMRQLMPYVDVLICGREDAAKLFGIETPASADGEDTPDPAAYAAAAEELTRQYAFQSVAFTLRETISASDTIWSGLLYTGGKAYVARGYRIHLVDRVGGGDSFTAGLIYGMLKCYDPQHTLDFATAASCLKQTIEQDFNLSFADEIELVVSGEATGRIRR
ncbi:MAG: sugar kinase [Eubacteriales bacterium]|nr:sugar kinase [Eubacteriales bacterium]